MKLYRILSLNLAALLALAAVALAAPRLTIPENEFDFGFSPQNSEIAHAFWLHSTGEDSLKILKVTPGCSCTQAPLQKNNLAAGDSTQLEVIFSTGRYTNQVTKMPRIQTNEGPPDKMVRITTYVQPNPDSTFPLVIKPFKLDLSKVGESLKDEATFTVHNISSQTLKLSMVYAPTDYLEITLPKQIAAGKSAEGSVKIRKEFLDKQLLKSFTFQLNDEKKTRFTVPVNRTPQVAAQPANKVAAPVGQH